MLSKRGYTDSSNGGGMRFLIVTMQRRKLSRFSANGREKNQDALIAVKTILRNSRPLSRNVFLVVHFSSSASHKSWAFLRTAVTLVPRFRRRHGGICLRIRFPTKIKTRVNCCRDPPRKFRSMGRQNSESCFRKDQIYARLIIWTLWLEELSDYGRKPAELSVR